MYMSRAKDTFFRTHHDTGTSRKGMKCSRDFRTSGSPGFGSPWLPCPLLIHPRVRKREDHERPPRIKDFPEKNKTTNTISVYLVDFEVFVFEETPMLSCCVALCPWSFVLVVYEFLVLDPCLMTNRRLLVTQTVHSQIIH